MGERVEYRHHPWLPGLILMLFVAQPGLAAKAGKIADITQHCLVDLMRIKMIHSWSVEFEKFRFAR